MDEIDRCKRLSASKMRDAIENEEGLSEAASLIKPLVKSPYPVLAEEPVNIALVPWANLWTTVTSSNALDGA
jgi:hypothetical protein